MSPICLLWGVTAGESPLCLCVRVHSSVINVSPLSTTNGNDRTQTNTHKNRGQVHSNRVFFKKHKVRPLCLLNLSILEVHLCVCLCSKQGMGGREAPMKATKPWNNRRFIGTFDVENTTKGDSGRYRCIVHSDKGVGVSNYGELTIKREYLSQSRVKMQNRPISVKTRQKAGMFSIRVTFMHSAKLTGDKQELLRVCRWKCPLRQY